VVDGSTGDDNDGATSEIMARLIVDRAIDITDVRICFGSIPMHAAAAAAAAWRMAPN